MNSFNSGITGNPFYKFIHHFKIDCDPTVCHGLLSVQADEKSAEVYPGIKY